MFQVKARKYTIICIWFLGVIFNQSLEIVTHDTKKHSLVHVQKMHTATRINNNYKILHLL